MVRMREKLQKDLHLLEEAMSRYEPDQTGTFDLSAVPKESPSLDSLLLNESAVPKESPSVDSLLLPEPRPSLTLQFAAKDRRGRPASAPPARIDADRLRAVIRPASAGTQRDKTQLPASGSARSRSTSALGGSQAAEVPL